jgi:hypothetical protein
MVLNVVLELGFVVRCEIGHPLDVFLFAVILVAAEPLPSNVHHADPGQARRAVEFQNINGVRDSPWARVFD